MDDIKPLFFATELSQELRRPQTQQIRTNRHKQLFQKQSLDPYQRFKKVKQQASKIKNQYNKTLSQTHRLQLSLNKLQRKKHITRAQFIKIYGNLKYKKYLEQTNNQNQSRSKSLYQQKFDRTKKKKLEQQLQRILSKNQEEQKNIIVQKKNRFDKQKWIQIKQNKKRDLFNWSKQQHDTIRAHHTQFVIRKQNISNILNERSRLNYMKKINKELNLLKEYENVIDEIGSFNIRQIQSLIIDTQPDKAYDTFFMTTKNTISQNN